MSEIDPRALDAAQHHPFAQTISPSVVELLVRAYLDALSIQPAKLKAEPVAWRWRLLNYATKAPGRWHLAETELDAIDRSGRNGIAIANIEPLYASPIPEQAGPTALAEYLDMIEDAAKGLSHNPLDNAAIEQILYLIGQVRALVSPPEQAGVGVKGLTAEQRETLASIVHDLREHSDAIHKGIAEYGSYNVPWGVLSWGKDTAARNAERIEEIIGDVCRQCGGRGIVDNPEARYERDNDTGLMETNDPEEIECPDCDGTGLAATPNEVMA